MTKSVKYGKDGVTLKSQAVIRPAAVCGYRPHHGRLSFHQEEAIHSGCRHLLLAVTERVISGRPVFYRTVGLYNDRPSLGAYYPLTKLAALGGLTAHLI